MNATSFVDVTMFVQNSTTAMIELWFIPLSIFMIVCAILIIIFATIFLLVIIFDNTCHTVPMMLVANSYLTLAITTSACLSMYIFTLKNDLKQIIYQDSLCDFRGYMSNSIAAAGNCSFLLQAVYRYIIVIHPNRLSWQSVRYQIFLICLTWIFAFLYSIAFLFTGDYIYNVDNQICQLPLRLSFSVIYTALVSYVIPVSMIMFIYFKLVRYVKEMSKRVTTGNTLSRAQRELKMVQRTVILVTTLVIICFPYALFLFLSFFNRAPKYHFRIAFAFIDVSCLVTIFIVFQFTEPLKTSLLKIIKRPLNVVVARVA